MGRTANPGVEPVELPSLDSEALVAGQNLMARQSTEVMAQFGDGLPYDRERLIAETRFFMGTAAEAMLEAGKRLIQLKVQEGHGEFIAICEERLGIPERTAQKMMSSARRFMSPKLEAHTTTLAALGKTKLIELLAEDDEELAVLAEGGTLAGLKLDDIDRMTSRELRKALREAREDAEATGRVLADKNAKIDALARELQKKPLVVVLEPDEQAKALRQEVAALAYEAETDITGKLREGFAKLAEHAEEHGVDHRVFQATLVRQLETLLAAIRSEFHLPEDLDLEVAPDWIGADVDSLVVEPAGA
jgi:predicted GNAT family N-acyltransferase